MLICFGTFTVTFWPFQGKDDKAKGGKKKKESELELKRGPPTYTTLATFHIHMEEFLEGDYEFKTVFKKDGIELASSLKGQETDRKVCFAGGV